MANIAVQYYDPGSGDDTPKYLDLKTGQPIDYADLHYYDVKDQASIQTGKTKLPEQDQQNFDQIFKNGGNNQGFATPGSTAQPRSMSNNFGYAHKPGFVTAATMAPGPAGMVAGGLSLAMNANNRQAVQDARQTLGLPQKSNLGGFIQDNRGLVANVNLTNPTNPDLNETVPVGFEGQDKTGRTMMTPNEARMRSLVNPGTMTEAAPQDVKDAKANFQNQGLVAPKQESIASKIAGNMFGSSYNTHPDDTANHTTRGMGLMDVSPSFKAEVENGTHVDSNGSIAGANYAHPERGDITAGLTDRTKETIGALATNTPGGINVSSAYRSPSVNESIGGATKSYHTTGQAFDVSTKGMTDQEKRDMVERGIMSGAMEIGTYGDQSLHMATDRRNPMNAAGVAAMYNRTESQLQNAPGWFQSGVMESHLAPTPTARPDDAEVKQMKDDDLTVGLQPQNVSQTTPSVNSTPTGWANMNAQQRYDTLSNDDKRMMAMTLAGEIDPTKTKIGTDDFTNEAYGITSTMDNRVGKYGTMAGVIGAPNQYSTWNNTTAANTAISNYNKNPQAYDNAVKGYYSDDKNNQGFTSYHSLNVNPGWGASMQNPTQIGAHVFGTLSEYQSQPTAVATNPAPMETPSLTNASSLGFTSGPTAAADNSSHFSGPSQVGTGGNNNNSSNGNNNGKSDSSAGNAGGGFANAATGGTNSSASSFGGFSNDHDKNDSSGYGGSRSDGWR